MVIISVGLLLTRIESVFFFFLRYPSNGMNESTFHDVPKCTDEDACDFADPELLEKIKAFQPPQLDIQGTIVAEETKKVSELPRGTCQGSLVGGGGDGCKDDPNYRHEGKSKKTCEWIKKKKEELCKEKSVSTSCPVSCGVCSDESPCEDDPSYRHKDKDKRNCKWIKKRKDKYCSKQNVFQFCPVSCDICSPPA